MIRIALIVIVCVYGLVSKSYAQPSAKFGLGIKGGLTSSTIDISGDLSALTTDPRVSYHAGIFGLLKVGMFGIQPEILFSRQGTDFKIDANTFKNVYDYVNVPLVFKFYPLLGLNIQFGPQFGFIVNAQRDRLDPTTGEILLQDIKDEFATADIGLTAGLGWDLPFGLSVDLRYNIGLTNALKEANNLTDLSDIKNYVLQASIGYRLVNFGD